MIVAPPGSPITSIAKLRDHAVGVVGGEINHGVVEALKKEYDLGHANVVFKDIAPSDGRRAVQAKEVSALLLVLPLTEKNLSFVKSLFREGPNLSPVLIPIDFAAAIAGARGLRKLRYSQGHLAGRAAGAGRGRHHLAGWLLSGCEPASHFRSGHRPHQEGDGRAQGSGQPAAILDGLARPISIPTPSSRYTRVLRPITTAPRNTSWINMATPSI